MYCIRGLRSSLCKVAYPSGEVSNLGSLAVDPSKPFAKGADGGYGSYMFNDNATGNPTIWNIESSSLSGLDPVTNVKFAKQIGVQGRVSDNGNKLPPNTNYVFITANHYMYTKYENQRYMIYRNSVPLSLVNELLVFQANIKKIDDVYSTNDKVRIDKKILDAGTASGVLMDVVVQRVVDSVPTASITAPSYSAFMYLYDTSSSLVTSYKDTYDVNKITTVYSSGVDAENISYRTVEFGIDSEYLMRYLGSTRSLRFSFGGIIGTAAIYLTSELKEVLIKAAGLRKYVSFRFNLGYGRGYLDSTPPNKPTNKDGMLQCLQHGSDFIPEATVVDPAGEFVIIKFNRLTKVDVLFNDVEHGFGYVTDSNNEIKITKRDRKFTAGGKLTITMKHRLNNTGTNSVYTYDIPDTIPPDAPVYTSAARAAIYGTGTIGDVVYVERDGVVLGHTTVTAVGSFEILLTDTVFSNGETVTLYTKDSANNKSPDVVVVIEDIASEVRVDMVINGDLLHQTSE